MRPVLIVLLSLAMGAAHAAGKPVVRAQIDAKGPALVGEQITLTIEVLVPNFFAGAPQWPAIDIPAAVVTLPEGMEQNVNDTIGGESYAGIRQTYRIVPQREGEFTLPPVKI